MGAGTITIPGETAEPPKPQTAQEIPQEQQVNDAENSLTVRIRQTLTRKLF